MNFSSYFKTFQFFNNISKVEEKLQISSVTFQQSFYNITFQEYKNRRHFAFSELSQKYCRHISQIL